MSFTGPYLIPYSGQPSSFAEDFSVRVPEPGLLAVYSWVEIAKNYQDQADTQPAHGHSPASLRCRTALTSSKENLNRCLKP